METTTKDLSSQIDAYGPLYHGVDFYTKYLKKMSDPFFLILVSKIQI